MNVLLKSKIIIGNIILNKGLYENAPDFLVEFAVSEKESNVADPIAVIVEEKKEPKIPAGKAPVKKESEVISNDDDDVKSVVVEPNSDEVVETEENGSILSLEEFSKLSNEEKLLYLSEIRDAPEELEGEEKSEYESEVYAALLIYNEAKKLSKKVKELIQEMLDEY